MGVKNSVSNNTTGQFEAIIRDLFLSDFKRFDNYK